MKKILLIVLLLSISCALVSACNDQKERSFSESLPTVTTTTTNNAGANEGPLQENSVSYSIYQISNGVQTDFDIAINQNPIDAAFVEADTQTLQLQYIEAWKAEYYASCQKYTVVLTETQSASFDELQLTWEETMLAQFALENEVIKSHHINDLLGTAYNSLYLSAICSAYREQTIHIKYLHYLKEISLGYTQTLSSLEFVYNDLLF